MALSGHREYNFGNGASASNTHAAPNHRPCVEGATTVPQYIKTSSRPTYKWVSDETRVEIGRRYLNGDATAKISRELGYTPSTICRTLLLMGIPTRPNGSAQKKTFTNQEIDSIVRWWNEGVPGLTIASRLGCSRHRVYRALRDNNIEYKPRSRIGPVHHNWKGGRNINNQGYASVSIPDDHAFISMRQGSARYVLEHRLVMAEYLGRPLLPHETVHHIDGDRLNNVIENLQLRIGSHGAGMVYRCIDCGSHRLEPDELKGAT